MLTSLRLRDFKGFRDAEIALGPLSLVIGANASGKSNLRDALRFLHGISRNYNVAEIIGEKYGEGGYREWSGLRGGAREACRAGTTTFELHLEFKVSRPSLYAVPYKYAISVEIGEASTAPHVRKESLYRYGNLVFDSHPSNDPPAQGDPFHIAVRLPAGGAYRKMGPKVVAMAHHPVLTQIVELARQQKVQGKIRQEVEETLRELESMRFVDFVPDAMRRPSLPGQIVLSDQGENLSSVLEGICSDIKTKDVLRSWIQELTPMDVVDFEFVADPQGKILVYLVEKSGRKISAYSASDGTLRFLGILAAFLGPKPARFYFVEEIDNGIHPARLYLLMNLLESRTKDGELQVFMTTHSPQLLRLLKPSAMPFASLTYRVEGVAETRIKSLPEIPHLLEVLKTSDIARLYEGGWMEQAMFYDEGEPAPFELEPIAPEMANDPKE